MQPIQGSTPRPPGDSSSALSAVGERPLSSQQRTVLEALITRIVALSQQQSAEVWAGLKHDLGMKNETSLLSKHYPAAEKNLNQRLTSAQTNHATRQIVQQLSDLLPKGNNRQAVSHYIRQEFGHSTLSQLTPQQLKIVLTLLQNNQLTIPQPLQRPATDRPLLAAEHSALNQQVAKLTAATGESGKLIWQSMLELSGVKSGELIPAKHFTLQTTWLQARQTLSQQSAPTMHSIQAALKQPLEPGEWKEIAEYSQNRFQAAPQTVLTTVQVQDILNQVFLKRAERMTGAVEVRNIQPIFNPLFVPFIEPLKVIAARRGLAFVLLTALIVIIVVMGMVWLTI